MTRPSADPRQQLGWIGPPPEHWAGLLVARGPARNPSERGEKVRRRGGLQPGDPFLPATRPTVAVTGAEADGPHSSGIPALRRPAKYVASYNARIFGTPKYPLAFKRTMLE